MVCGRATARRALAARRCGMKATTPASTKMNKARYTRFDARSWYRTKRKSGTLDTPTTFSGDSYRVPLTVATTLKYIAPAPEGRESPLAVYDCRVCPVCAGVEFPSLPDMVPQTTWVSDTVMPAGPRTDHVTSNFELLDTDDGYEFRKMDG